ncbi:MAG: KH domain-containing protein [Pseudomonadota bacterium]
MENLLRKIVEKIVVDPDQIEIEAIHGEQAYILKLKVAKEDTGRIIGKSGRNAEAIRTILQAVGAKKGHKVIVEILD